VQVLTGDEPARGRVLADQLQVPVHANLLPEDKLTMIRSLRSAGPVAMIGDGINDAPALAEADVGLAMGCGADLSRQTADVCLLSNDLRQILELTDLSRETCRTIRWNLTWALTYNALAIPIAAAGWLNPIIAAIAMAVSSLLVVSNSLRLAQNQNGSDVQVGQLTDSPPQIGSVASDEASRPEARSQVGAKSEAMA
jgi:P-type E1-E2 ATPase